MSDTEPQPVGRDLARLALAQYKANAKTQPATKKKTARRKRAEFGNGRDPVGLAAVIQRLNVDQEWNVGLDGGSIIDQWPTLCPEYVGKVQPVHYDPDSGRLDLRPGSDAYGQQLRLLGGQLAKRINDKLGKTAVRAIRVLPVGAVGDSPAISSSPAAAPERPTAPAPIRTRADAAPGYHRALEAALAGRERAAAIDPTAEARDRMFGDIRGTLREPETAFVDAVAALEDIAPPSRGNDSETIRQAAIKRARDERAGRAPAIPTAFQRTA